ncbi:hypothetical protein DICPUDRAFT_146909 [Dictyostelium purpureum]|uniref:Uncharacterized protein n=1 Tax=Dictyostelium purpureum TaxID=5786 RepID=F0Z774_DICPU|nr:uncharacterized protein DICPUDRAFT_146909 [Dictyostelium purpureum]EGC40194.1 hypothetical protein DICPUDRAFT_146909 [Dictyostelium purpureum]|eukprot:XP_003283263.1 hypothetical protein DICPUDRAFT_146909 [Dictyostelium purpureum]
MQRHNNNINNSNINNETLFWNVFKNKYLFFKIFSNFKKIDTYQYIFMIPRIIDGYGVEVLRDKLKSNSFLTFPESISYGESLRSLIKKVKKETKENNELYSLLFRYIYQKNIFSTNAIRKEVLIEIIDSSNLLAMKIFTNFFQNEEEQINGIVLYNYLGYNTITSYDSFKMLCYLAQANIISLSDIIGVQLKTDPTFKEIKLKQLIKIMQFSKIDNGILEIFTDQELNSNIKSLLKTSTKDRRSILLGILEIASVFTVDNLGGKNFMEKVNRTILKVEHREELSFHGGNLLQQLQYYIENTASVGDSNYRKATISIKEILINGNEDFDIFGRIVSKNKELMDSIFTNEINFKKILPLIKSTFTLDFYFEYYQNLAFINNSCHWELITSIPIIEQYEMLMESIGLKFSISDDGVYKEYIENIPTLEILAKIANNSNYYIEDFFDLEFYSVVIGNYINRHKFKQVLSLFQEFYSRQQIFDGKSAQTLVRNSNFLNWVLDISSGIEVDNNGHVEFKINLDTYSEKKSDRISFIRISFLKLELPYLLYTQCRYNQIFRFLETGVIRITEHLDCEIVRIEFIEKFIRFLVEQKEKIIEYLSNKEQPHKIDSLSLQNSFNKSSNYLRRIISFHIFYGNLDLLIYILSKYSDSIFKQEIISINSLKSVLDSKCKQHPKYFEINQMFLSNIKLKKK